MTDLSDIDVEKRRSLVASAVRVVLACHPLPDASPDEVRAYQEVLESVGIEAVLVAEPKWTKRRGTKRSFLFKVAYNKATTRAKRYLRELVRGDELDDDRTGGSTATPEEQAELREDVMDARAWQLALVRRMAELAAAKPHYRVALLAYQEKAVTGYGFLARAAERLGIDAREAEKAMDAFKKRLQRDEVIARLRRTAPRPGLLAVLDDAAEMDQQHDAAPEAAEDFDDVDDADRADHGGAGAEPGLARPAGGEPGSAAGPDACGAAGTELHEDGAAAGEGRSERADRGEGGAREQDQRRHLTTWMTFPAGPRPAGCRTHQRSARTSSRAGATAGRRLTSPRAVPPFRPVAHPLERWGPPARAAPPAPS